VCGAPISVINLIDAGRLWFKSEIGLGVREAPLDTWTAAEAILQHDLLVVKDLQSDERFAGNPLLAFEPPLRFYAGALLKTSDGQAIGTVSVLDYETRDLDEEQEETLRGLARQVMIQLELRRTLRIAQEANEALERTGDALAHAIRSKDELLGMISHELRAPLTVILGNATLLQEDRVRTVEQQQQALSDISFSGRQLERLVTNMLVLARDGVELENDPDLEPLLLQRILPDAIDEHLRLHPTPAVTLHVDAQLPAVLGRPGYVSQLVTNLLGNAAKYADPLYPVEVTATRDGAEVQITVADRGADLDVDEVSALFEPFYRSNSARQKAGGVGLGLAVCRRLMDAQGGRIWAAPREGGGLEVCFAMQIAPD
jgi:signal transduction histidine kinase